jgi:hypothetical protein
MDTPSFEDIRISQIPALQMLGNLGCTHVINQNQHDKVIGFIMQKQLYRYAI